MAKDYAEIDLIPKKKIQNISLIVIRISQKDSKIKSVMTYNAFDDSTLLEFSEIKFQPIDPGVFEFNPPQGIDILKMN